MTRFTVPLLLALAGLVLFGQGAYIHAKALLAQVLLERAFAETIASGRVTKPWSWADTWPVARIEVRRLGASAVMLAGSSGQALAFGPGHVELTPDAKEACVRIEGRVRVEARTGVEMEALTAVAVAGLALYDMCKAVDREMTIEAIRLVEKSGGRSGSFVRRGER